MNVAKTSKSIFTTSVIGISYLMDGVPHISENQSLSLFFVFPLVLLNVHHQPQILLITTKTFEELHIVAENNMKYKAAVTANIH